MLTSLDGSQHYNSDRQMRWTITSINNGTFFILQSTGYWSVAPFRNLQTTVTPVKPAISRRLKIISVSYEKSRQTAKGLKPFSSIRGILKTDAILIQCRARLTTAANSELTTPATTKKNIHHRSLNAAPCYQNKTHANPPFTDHVCQLSGETEADTLCGKLCLYLDIRLLLISHQNGRGDKIETPLNAQPQLALGKLA